MRYRWNKETRELEEIGAGTNLESVHYVIHDTMDDTINHADGKRYASKRAFRAATKAAGFVEIGDQSHALLKNVEEARARMDREQSRRIVGSIREAEHMLREGYRPPLLPRVRGQNDIL